MRLWNREPEQEIIKIKHLRPSDNQLVVDVSKELLFDNFSKIFESKHAYYGISKEEIVYRVQKRQVYLKAEKITVNPQTARIETDMKGILELQRKYNAEVWETPDCYAVCFPGIMWISQKTTAKEE